LANPAITVTSLRVLVRVDVRVRYSWRTLQIAHFANRADWQITRKNSTSSTSNSAL